MGLSARKKTKIPLLDTSELWQTATKENKEYDNFLNPKLYF